MDSLFRKVRKSPQVGKSAKHSKLDEGWEENKEAVTEGVTFYLKYIGSTLLDELPEGESYGEGISTKAIQRIVNMAKAAAKKLNKVCMTVTPKGIQVVDITTKEVGIDMSIYRISFCTADKNHDKVFAFIGRNSINETMECHAYLCAKPKIAQAVTYSVSQAFKLAMDIWERSENVKKQKNENKQQTAVTEEDQSSKNINNNTKSEDSPEVSLISDSPARLPHPSSNNSLIEPVDETSSPRHRSQWQTFGDDGASLDDCFSQLAENRHKKRPVSSFTTDLRQEDVDASVTEYMEGSKCFEAFSRQKSMEDLMNI